MLGVLNPAPCDAPPHELAGRYDIVVPNEIETEQLTGLACDGDQAVKAARRVCDQWARGGAVVTLGARGAIVVDRSRGDEQVEWLPAYPVKVLDTVGAGDAFCGALAARLAAGDPLVEAARHANAAGALATTKRGAAPSMPRHEDIPALRDSDR